MRVAVSQFATSSNVQENLSTCIRMIKKVSVCEPTLIILPEYSNTLPCYVDHNQAWNEALTIDGDFLQRIGEQAKKYNCYILINVTLRRDILSDLQKNKQNSPANVKSNITITSCLFSPLGKLTHQADKQTLTKHENDFFICANKANDSVGTPFGKLGILTGKDSINFEKSRDLALGGVQLFCNSISTFALDQSHLHDPARACENNVFMATANKVGLLAPIEQSKNLSVQVNTSKEQLVGAGQSQIVSPDGKVLARVVSKEEGFVFADIELADTGLDNKFRPDGTQFYKQYFPELYLGLTVQAKQKKTLENKVPQTANVAIFATYKSNEQAIEDVCHYIENNLSDIIQLPELFFIADKATTNNVEQLNQIARLSQQVIKQVSSVLRPFQYVCTSLVIDDVHQAVLINEHGLMETQLQLHFCRRYQWTALGDEIKVITLPLEQGSIIVAMLTADDANIPEMVKVAALNDIHLLLVPFDIQEACEGEYNLLSRSVENRICIVAASREKSFISHLSNDSTNGHNTNKVKTHKSTGLIVNLTAAPELLPQWKSCNFNGYINQPLVKNQHGKITKAVIHPIAASKKQIT